MPSANFEIKKKCKCCGATFLAKTLDSWYCSRKCSQKAYDRREAAKKKIEQLNEMVAHIPNARDYISVQEAVAIFGINRDTVYRLIRKGGIPAMSSDCSSKSTWFSKFKDVFKMTTKYLYKIHIRLKIHNNLPYSQIYL